jgi:hypothetical protein
LLSPRTGSKFITLFYHIPVTNRARERVPRTSGGKVEEPEDNSKRYISARREDECDEAVDDSDNDDEDSDEYDSEVVESEEEGSGEADNSEDAKLGAGDSAEESEGSAMDKTEG